MKTKNRFAKAIAVLIIIGIGMIFNMNLKVNLNESIQSGSMVIEESQIKSDTLEANNKLYIYTKSIIQSGIQHLISNL